MVITHIVTVALLGKDVYEIDIRYASALGVSVMIGIREFKERVYPTAVSVETGVLGRIQIRTGGIPLQKERLAANLNALLNDFAQGTVETAVRINFTDPHAERQVRLLFARMPPEQRMHLLKELSKKYGTGST